MFGLFKKPYKDPNESLKKATERKKNGDLQGAIELLNESYRLIATSKIVYSVDTFLRLPLYLQELGRKDEAWKEFNKLLAYGYPNQIKNKEILPMDHSQIYDKMRLFLQREKKFNEGVKYGMFSILSSCVGLHNQNRKEDLNKFVEKENLLKLISRFTKHIKLKKVNVELAELVLINIKNIHQINLDVVGNNVSKIIKQNCE